MDPIREFYRNLTEFRLMLVATLVLTPWLHLWLASTLIMAISILSSLIDGSLARKWEVTSARGTRLHYIASVALVFGGVISTTISGTWPWWVLAMIAFGYGLYQIIYRRLSGKWRVSVFTIYSVVHVMVLGGLMVTYIGHWLHADYGVVSGLVIVAGAFVAVAKAEDIKSAFDLVRGNAR